MNDEWSGRKAAPMRGVGCAGILGVIEPVVASVAPGGPVPSAARPEPAPLSHRERRIIIMRPGDVPGGGAVGAGAAGAAGRAVWQGVLIKGAVSPGPSQRRAARAFGFGTAFLSLAVALALAPFLIYPVVLMQAPCFALSACAFNL